MPFDYKKEYKEFYLPPREPSIVEIPKMNYLAIRGKGNPNEENGEYKATIELLYTIAFTTIRRIMVARGQKRWDRLYTKRPVPLYFDDAFTRLCNQRRI